MDWHEWDRELIDRLDRDMAYKAMPAGLEGELPDTSQTSGWGYLWNPAAEVVVGTVDNDFGGCDAFAFGGFDLADLAARADDASMPWVDLVEDYATAAVPFDPAGGLGDLPKTGWLRAWPLWGSEAPVGAACLRAALTGAETVARRGASGAVTPAVDAAHAAWLAECLEMYGVGPSTAAFVEWLTASPDTPKPPSTLEALESRGVYVPFTLDVQSIPEFLRFEDPVDDYVVERACERATGRPLGDLLGAWADAIADLTDHGGNPGDMVGRARVQGLEEALRSLGSRREDLVAALAYEAEEAKAARGPFEASLTDLAGSMGAEGLDEGAVARAVKWATGKDPAELLDAWTDRGPGGLDGALESLGGTRGGLEAELDRAAQRGPAKSGRQFRVLELAGDDALLISPYPGDPLPYVIAQGWDPTSGTWSSGSYRSDLLEALGELHGTHYVDPGDPEMVCSVFWTREDIVQEFEDSAGRRPTDEEVDEVVAAMGSDLQDLSIARGWEVVCEAVGEVAGDGPSWDDVSSAARQAKPSHDLDR